MSGGKRIAVLVGLAVAPAAGLAVDGVGSKQPAEAARAQAAVALLKDVQGRSAGIVRLLPRGRGAVTVSVRARRLEPGFHALHIHDPRQTYPQDLAQIVIGEIGVEVRRRSLGVGPVDADPDVGERMVLER